ncbi:MAG TPA: DinB family protein [Phnomibacter sp.]|nr:DinB family protein [Phnomibacter sp.]
MKNQSHTYTALELLEKLSTQTEAQLQWAIAECQMLPPAVVEAVPTPGAWSANQCLQHLNSYGRYYLPLLQKAIKKADKQNPQTSNTYTPGWLGGWFARTMETGPGDVPKKKMKAPANHTPAANIPSHAVIAEFIDQLELLLELLQEAAHVDLASARVPISIAPFITIKLGDTFWFLAAHIQRHVAQAKRAIDHVPNSKHTIPSL